MTRCRSPRTSTPPWSRWTRPPRATPTSTRGRPRSTSSTPTAWSASDRCTSGGAGVFPAPPPRAGQPKSVSEDAPRAARRDDLGAGPGGPGRRRSPATALQAPADQTPARCTSTVASTACLGSVRELRALVNPAGDEEIAMRPDEELLGVVVHSGLVLARSQDVVAALRRITAFPAGLSLDAVVLAREVSAEAANRREREATTQREAQVAGGREREATAQQESKAAAQWEGTAAAERERLRKQARTEQRYLPQFQEGDTLRLALLTPVGDAQWLDAYQSTSSRTEDRYRLEASYWVTPLPRDGLLTLVCAWPEIGLPEALTDVVLPDLAVRAVGTRALWDVAEDF